METSAGPFCLLYCNLRLESCARAASGQKCGRHSQSIHWRLLPGDEAVACIFQALQATGQGGHLFKLVVPAGEGQHKIARRADALDDGFLPGGFQGIQGLALGPDGPCWRRLPLQGCFLLRRSYLLRDLSPAQPASGARTLQTKSSAAAQMSHVRRRYPASCSISSATLLSPYLLQAPACRAFSHT